QRRRAPIFAIGEVIGPPDAAALPLIDFNRRIDHGSRWRIAVVERRGIDDRLERGTRLAIGLRRAIELALVEGEAADHRQHTAGVGVHRDHGAGDFRYLLEAILAVDRITVLEQGIDIDDVTRLQHLRYRCWRLAFQGPRGRLGPFHAVERNEANLALLADRAAEITPWLETDAGGLLGGFDHHRHLPWRNVGERFDIGELDAPVAGNIQLLDCTAIALHFVKSDEAGHHGLPRFHLNLRIQRGAHRQTAFIKLLLAITLKDVAADFLGKIFTGEGVGAVDAVGDDQR